jgi:pilus assembly protein CpaC
MAVRPLGRVTAILLAFAVGLPPAVGAQSVGKVNLAVGAQKVLTIQEISRIAIGDPAVADVKTVGSNQILVTGTGEGRTTLLVWKGSGQQLTYHVTVRKQDPIELVAELKKLVGEIDGVSVRSLGDAVYLEGRAYTPQDVARIEQIASMYPGVRNLVKVTANAKELVAQSLNAAFQRLGLKNVQATAVGATVFLEGSVESQQDLQKAELVTRALGEKVENLVSVGIKRMILSEVQFVEIRRSAKDRYGVKYPTDISGTGEVVATINKGLFPSTAPQGTSTTTIKASSDFALGFQNNDGFARILAQPKLVCASGEQAEFLAGGEVPIPLVTNNQFAVQYKQYGIILKLRPTADRHGNIQTEIEAETSEVDTSVAVSAGGSASVPGFRTRKVRTNVTVRHGETIVLSGVFSHDEQKFVSKLPALGHIPIIGELFKNRGFDSSKRELIIFVQPKVVSPESERIKSLIDDGKNIYRQAKSELSFNLLD